MDRKNKKEKTTDKSEKIKQISEKLEQGISDLFESDRYKAYLSMTSKFHSYSYNNIMLIMLQCPNATQVAGYNVWKNKFHRNVKQGEKGIKIIAPMFKKVKRAYKDNPNDTETKEKEITITYYKVATVFDISQTEGEDLPTLGVDELEGKVKDYNDLLSALKSISPVTVKFGDISGGSKGYYSHINNEIVIKKDMSELQTIKTLIHEITHSKLHNNTECVKDKQTKEVEAESVAYIVSNYFGYDTTDYSFGYITGWSNGREMNELKGSLDTIRKTSAEIIDGANAYLNSDQTRIDATDTQVQSGISQTLTPQIEVQMPQIGDQISQMEILTSNTI